LEHAVKINALHRTHASSRYNTFFIGSPPIYILMR